ncbi:ISWI chromatin-remodeling complex ATPase ISW2 [Pseudocercospora fuligena]|uniref:ISWI chromatin-remodeling complex ATPase ISW2 n=1 Tax=Pseudocercospora fuligena TaxID=685502 RepID=A0A8H6RVK4_9PEZI|nr:ISWI chromatin-remodeling complex ATPase ISW2 [Pseudocercospora fuligena]
MIQHGAETIFESKDGYGAFGKGGDDDLDAILAAGEEKTKEMNAKYEKLGLDDLQKFSSEAGTYEWNGESFINRKKEIGLNWINPSKRERKEQSYSMDKYYRTALATGGPKPDPKPKVPRAPKQMSMHDYQFFSPRLGDLQEKETAYFRKENNLKAPLADGEEDTLDQRMQDQELEQQNIDNAEPLTEEEIAEKEQLATEGFGEWNKRDFQQFINGSAKYGRNDYEAIALEVDSKNPKEVKEYAKVFWKRYKEIHNWEKHISAIKEGEQRAARVIEQRELLKKKLAMYRVPLQQLKLNYTVSTTNKKVYTEEEDRFLLVMLNKYGIDTEGLYEKIRDEIRDSPLFRFDWFFLSRTPQEISRRCATLITTVTREMEGTNGKENKRAADDDDEEEEEPVKKKGRPSGTGVKVSYNISDDSDADANDTIQNKAVNGVKGTPNGTSRAASVDTTASGGASKAKSKGRKR